MKALCRPGAMPPVLPAMIEPPVLDAAGATVVGGLYLGSQTHASQRYVPKNWVG